MSDREPRDEVGRDRKQAKPLERAAPDPDALVLAAQEIEAGPMPIEPDDEEHARDQERLAKLTPRQLEVVILTARSLTARDIARELGCAEKTVSKHRSDIAKRTGLSGKVEMTRFACRMGLVTP